MRISFRLCATAVLLTLGVAQFVRSEDAKPDIDINRVRNIYERQQKGEKISPEDQAYLEKAKAGKQRSDQPTPKAAAPAGGGGIDWDKAKALFQREQAGEKLTPEEQDYLAKAKAVHDRGENPAAPGQAPAGKAGDGNAPGIDWEKAKALYQREQNGEKLSAEEQAYLDKAKAARGGGGQKPAGQGNPLAGFDIERLKTLHQKAQAGEKLSPEDQDYLDKARAALQGGRRPDGKAGQPGGNPNAAGIDWERAKALHQKEQAGEKLSPEDQAYLDKAKAAIQGRGRPDGDKPNKPGDRSAPPTGGKTSVDLTPLTDLATATYKEQDGGLYGKGQNTPPADHLKLALAAAAAIQPLDQNGAAAPTGKIALLTIGMSNTTMESSSFKKLADSDARKSSDLVIVDGAQGGKDAAAWINAPGSEKVWETADARLGAAGVSSKQVQVLWIKQALMGPARHGEFPKHAEDLKSDIEQILVLARQRYPNVKLAYLSSRIYAGYASTELNPEPYSYESAFSVRWVIQDQMKSASSINADPAKGEVKAPVVLWGPYLWVDGVKGRKTDSFTFERADLAGDGTHPSASGREKVAQMLLAFFTTDETAKGWFLKK